MRCNAPGLDGVAQETRGHQCNRRGERHIVDRGDAQVPPLIEIGRLIAIEPGLSVDDVRRRDHEARQHEEEVDPLVTRPEERAQPEAEVDGQSKANGEPAHCEPEVVGENPQRRDAAEDDHSFEPGALSHPAFARRHAACERGAEASACEAPRDRGWRSSPEWCRRHRSTRPIRGGHNLRSARRSRSTRARR